MRTKNTLKNIAVGLGSQLALLIVSFVSRTVFIKTLGTEYLGINGLFSNILTLLSFANLGIGSSMIYSLYKPLANKDEDKIQAYMNFYKKAYKLIGLIIFAMGISLLPFLQYFMKEVPNIAHLRLIYFLFVINTTASYFFIYKSSIIEADQKNYILTGINSTFAIFSSLVQTIILLATHNYILSLSIITVISILQNYYIVRVADRRYPIIRQKNDATLTGDEKKEIYKNLFALALYNISGAVYYGTDNIVISSFIGVSIVGIYSNYMIVISNAKNFISRIFNSFIASVGNLNVTESEEKKYSVFNTLFFLNFWVYGFCAIAILILINPFITLWLGKDFLLSNWVVIIIFLDLFTGGLISSSSVFKSSSGLYWNGKFAPIACVIINLGLSIVLVRTIGLPGVLLGTIISRLLTYSWVDPYVTFKYVLKKPLGNYFLKYLLYFLVVILAAAFTGFISSFFVNATFMNFILKGIVCLIIPNVIFFMVFHKSEEFKYLRSTVFSLISEKFARKNNLYFQ